MLLECVKVRAEEEATFASQALPSIVKRFFAEAVTRYCQRIGCPVPYSKGKHANRFFDCATDSPSVEAGKQSFSIRMTAPLRSFVCSFELCSQVLMIIDFAIERNHVTA